MKELRAFVLLSGGMDSTVCLNIARTNKPTTIEGVTIDYGQRHAKEQVFAAHQCSLIGAKHTVLYIGDVLRGGLLTDKTQQLPDIRYDQFTGMSPTYVPFRNGTMLSVLAAHAQRWIEAGKKKMVPRTEREALIYFGAHAEDAHNWAYPDCTPEFIGSMANAILVGTDRKVRLLAPLQHMTKDQVVTLGMNLGVNFSQTWTCHAGGDVHCGKCPTCYARKDAFAKARVFDPTTYAHA